MSRARSYSRNASLRGSGWKNGIVSVAPTLFEPAKPKYTASPAGADVRGLQPELLRAVLVLGERQRIDDVQHELAVGRVRRELLEHLADARRHTCAAVGRDSVASFEKKK